MFTILHTLQLNQDLSLQSYHVPNFSKTYINPSSQFILILHTYLFNDFPFKVRYNS